MNGLLFDPNRDEHFVATGSGESTDSMPTLEEMVQIANRAKQKLLQSDARFGLSLAHAGFAVIPNDNLRRDEIMVSREVFNAMLAQAREAVSPT